MACYLAFITQAITANFVPLLFIKFRTDLHISYGEIALIPIAFFLTQLFVDFFCARFVDAMLRGLIESIEDEDGSGIDEPGITIVRPDNSYLIIGLSEIKNIEIIPKVGDRNGKR